MHAEHFSPQPNFIAYFKKTGQDFLQSLYCWRICVMMGFNDIRKRYARSRLGQFWITLSLAINIGVLGLVWSYLFKISLNHYFPYLATSMVIWTYISACIIEATTVYVVATGYLKELALPKLIYINSLFIRNSIILIHNLPVLIPIYLYFGIAITPLTVLYFFVGWLLTSVFLYAVLLIVSLLSLRYRDMVNITTSLLQIFIYVTPVMWTLDLMPEHVRQYILLNPLTIFLSLWRDPLLGKSVPHEYVIYGLLFILLVWTIALPFFSRYKSRIVYWL